MNADTLIGVLGAGCGASVDARGRLRPERAGWELEWWVGADDRWHMADREVAVRQTLVDGMPVVRTAMRVPAGDAVQSLYAVPAAGIAAGAVAVVEVANESPAPFVVALVVSGAGAVDVDGPTIFVDGRAALRTARSHSRWAMAADGTTRDLVTSGAASVAPFASRRDRGAGLVAAFLYPVAHRTTFRAAVALGTRGLGPVGVQDLPTGEEVARGWRAQLDRGMRVELPDPALQAALDTARGATLLAGQAWRADPRVVAALEDWGFDIEATDAWSRLTGRERRRLARRVPDPSSDTGSWAVARRNVGRNPAGLLTAVRDVLVRERGESIELLAEWPTEWVGLPLDVRDAPTRLGRVSASVRWHGDRPALLWDAPPGVTISVPGLDPAWSSDAPRGEMLLSASGVRDAHGGDLAGA